jgi:5-carboxymethyl-2-hydroxymuconate isomerase
MPHVIVEYTDNLSGEADIPALLRTIAGYCGESGGVLPLAGVRVRAIRLTEYVIADGRPEYAFVNVTVKMGQGRDAAFKTAFFGGLFERIKAELGAAMAARPVALSMYIEELDEAGAFRHNGVREALGLPQKG